MSNTRSFPAKHLLSFIAITFIFIGLSHFFSGMIVAQTLTWAPMLFPLMTLFLMVFHTLIAVFMLMKYFCDRQRLYLVPIALAFAGSALLMTGTLNSYINWLQCEVETIINYNNALTCYIIRNLLMAFLFCCSVILYTVRHRPNLPRHNHIAIFVSLIGIVIIAQGLAWFSTNPSFNFSFPFIDNTTLFYSPLLRNIVLNVLIALWGVTLVLMIIKTRMRNLFWYSGYLFCAVFIYTLIILKSSTYVVNISWYLARLFEVTVTLFLIFVLLIDVFRLYYKSNNNYMNSYQNSIRDPLTRLYNRSYFYDTLKKKLSGTSATHPVSVVVCDLDHFKRINDNYGHLQGDHVIQFVATILQTETREEDIAARIGGEEFALMLTNTDTQRAGMVAERIRQTIEEHSLAQLPEQITISMGIYCTAEATDAAETCVQHADEGMYQAKAQGRNQVVIWQG